MFNGENSAASARHAFVFHGKASSFFVICLVNLLLTIITLGIYLPWAFVKTRRYVYENMELNGARFNYQATGGAFFVSWLLMGVLLFVLSIVCGMINPALNFLPMIIMVLIMPVLAVKGLRYQAMMTRLNNVRFGFNCRAGTALWTMLGIPFLLILAVVIFIGGVSRMIGVPESVNGLFIYAITIAVLTLVTTGAVNGIVYGKWMQLLGNNARFGIHLFSTKVDIKRCMVICITSMLMLVPFLIVIAKLLTPLFMAFILAMSMGGMDPTSQMALVMDNQLQVAVSYILYFTGIILLSVFAFTALRNLFINGLRLGDSLSFHSNITFVGLLMQVLLMTCAVVFTFGLAYPWVKIRYIRYLANNTFVVGNLDEVALTDSDEPNDSGFVAALSRGTMPAIPFI